MYRYKSNVMELSKRFKDRPKTSKEEILYWTEYVIKHKGAHHLKSAALKLSWYQYLLLDVLIAFVLILSVGLCIILFIIKTLKNQIFKCINFKFKRE